MEPSITQESDVLFDENDMGEAGRRMHGSLLMLALRCNCVPERAELASLTIELAPTLGPEEFPALLRIQPVMSNRHRSEYEVPLLRRQVQNWGLVLLTALEEESGPLGGWADWYPGTRKTSGGKRLSFL